MTIRLMVRPHFSFVIFSKTVLGLLIVSLEKHSTADCWLREGEVPHLWCHGILSPLLRELILINARNYNLTKSNLFSVIPEVYSLEERKAFMTYAFAFPFLRSRRNISHVKSVSRFMLV